MKKIVLVAVALALSQALLWGHVAYEAITHAHEIAAGAGGLAKDFMDAAKSDKKN
jgi:hypothetical protein